MSRRISWLFALIIAVAVTTPADAQFYGFGVGRLYVAPVVPAPVVPAPIGGVRIRTPFFSLDTNPGYARYSVARPYLYAPTVPQYYYRIDSVPSYTLPSYEYRYGYATPGSNPYPSARSLGQPILDPYTNAPHSYRRGTNGGIPEITSPQIEMSRPRLSADPLGLVRSAESLMRSLQRRGDEDNVWMEYLKPDKVAEAARSGSFDPSLSELVLRYEGVQANSQLRSIQTLPGFASTAQGLRAWVDQFSQTGNSILDTPIDQQNPGAASVESAEPQNTEPERQPVNGPTDNDSIQQPSLNADLLPTPAPDVQPAE